MSSQPWVRLPVPVDGLPLLGAPTTNTEPQPANSAPIPEGFDPAAPGTVFGYLPRGRGDVFPLQREPAHVVAPYLRRERLTARTRALARLKTYPYSLATVEEDLRGFTRFKPSLVAFLISEITYSQSSASQSPATNAGMTDGSFNTGDETATDDVDWPDPSWVQMDLGGIHAISSVTVGCDFDEEVGGWGAYFTENCDVEISDDGATWTPLFNTGTFTQGIQTYPVTAEGRYIRIYSAPDADSYLCVTEFYATPA